MPGLLDFASDPQGMQGLALLAAAAPSMAPQNFAGRLAQAGSNYQGLLNDQLKQKVTQAQLAEFNTKNQLQQFQLQRLKDWQALLTGGGSPAAPTFGPNDISSPGAFMPAADGMGPVAPLDQAPAALTARPQQGFQFGLRGMPDANSRAVAASMTPDEYMKLYATQSAPQTDIEKLMAAQGIDRNSPVGQQLLAQATQKANYVAPVNARPGSILRNPVTGQPFAFNPHIPEGSTPSFDASGNVIGMQPIPGALGAISSAEQAKTLGVGEATPTTAYNASGAPIFSTKATDVRRAAPQPDGDPSATSTPFQRAGSDVASLQREIDGVNRSMAPASTKKMQLDILNAELAKAQAGASGAPAPVAGSVTPVPRLGFGESQTVLAKGNAERYNTTITQASDSPTRVNVYDNILNLSKSGVNSGPGEQWKNMVKGFAANTPFLSSVTGKWKDEVAGFQELQKFMYQNAQRSWQAAGGTGTDSQLESFTRANPNDKMFPNALQAMAEWGKAGELALQGKTNAMQTWKDQNGGNVANLDTFDRSWRNSFDPILFQLKTMDPARAQVYVDNLKKTNPSGYSSLMMKASALKNLGGL